MNVGYVILFARSELELTPVITFSCCSERRLSDCVCFGACQNVWDYVTRKLHWSKQTVQLSNNQTRLLLTCNSPLRKRCFVRQQQPRIQVRLICTQRNKSNVKLQVLTWKITTHVSKYTLNANLNLLCKTKLSSTKGKKFLKNYKNKSLKNFKEKFLKNCK